MLFKLFGLIILIKKKSYVPKTGAKRAKRLYGKRRRDGLCKRCAVVVTETNKVTKKLYSSCKECKKRERIVHSIK